MSINTPSKYDALREAVKQIHPAGAINKVYDTHGGDIVAADSTSNPFFMQAMQVLPGSHAYKHKTDEAVPYQYTLGVPASPSAPFNMLGMNQRKADELGVGGAYKVLADAAASAQKEGIARGRAGKIGTGALGLHAPGILGTAALAPLLGAGIGAFTDAGVGRGALRGLGAGVGGLGGLLGGGYLADYMDTLDTVKNLDPVTRGAISLASLLAPAALGSYLGYKGTKAMSKSDKEKEKERTKSASVNYPTLSRYLATKMQG